MKKNLREFSKIIFLTVALVCILLADDYLLPKPVLHDYKWYLLLFFVLQSILINFLVMRGVQRDALAFQGRFFAGISIRMLLSIAVIFGVIYLGEKEPLRFIMSFFSLYFLYVAFEVYSLLITLRKQS